MMVLELYRSVRVDTTRRMDRAVTEKPTTHYRHSPFTASTRDALYAMLFAFFAVAAISDLVFLALFLIFEVRNFFWAMVAKPLLAAGLIAALVLLAVELAGSLRRAPVTFTRVAAVITIIEACNLALRMMDGPGMIIPLGASLSLLVILLIPTAIRRKAEKQLGFETSIQPRGALFRR